MISALKPFDEDNRLRALRSYELLDTACEISLDGVASLAARLTGASSSMISLVDADRQWFKSRFGIDQIETARDQAFCAHAILEPDRALVVPDTLDDPRFADNPMVQGGPRIRFYAGQPLVNPDGYALGTLCVVDPRPRDLSADQRDSLKVLADALMTTLEFRRLSRIDPLTGLSNRAAFMSALDRALAALRMNEQSFGLLYLDLDGFKRVNDSLGHEAGDRLLREVASRLSRIVRQEDMVARIGGDEFVILCRTDRAWMRRPSGSACSSWRRCRRTAGR